MHRFWPIVEPILTSLRPRSIVEIGAGGPTTGELLRFARDHDAVLHVVAPAADLGRDVLADDGGDHLVRHPGSSIETLPEVAGAVVVHSVPSNSTVVGIPGRVVRTRAETLGTLEHGRVAASAESEPSDVEQLADRIRRAAGVSIESEGEGESD